MGQPLHTLIERHHDAEPAIGNSPVAEELWVEWVCRLHGKSLKNVVFPLNRCAPHLDEAFAQLGACPGEKENVVLLAREWRSETVDEETGESQEWRSGGMTIFEGRLRVMEEMGEVLNSNSCRKFE